MSAITKQKPELLAPAGSVKVFEKAVEAGADGVYIGAPGLNARAQSRDFSMAEIAAMIKFARTEGVKLYLAANSLLKEDEIPGTLETLAILEELAPDGLIIQDLGLYHLCRKYFPDLTLHASTLFNAHNSLAVEQMADMGFKRVVLARELTLEEISAMAKQSRIELEVFVHGALCFSYSGLCLFSSYLGGKSGLRGRCVQPCRRRYRWKVRGRKPGYFFSMNDLGGVELVHKLARAGVSSFKIEGRLRSAHYVASVVRAYRMVIDGPAGDGKLQLQARELLAQAMGRKTSRGYLSSPRAKELISPYHSGNIGLFLGRIAKDGSRGRVSFNPKQPVQVGDRLRLHQEQTGERVAFTLRRITIGGRSVNNARPGAAVTIEVPAQVKKGDTLFKVDSRAARESERGESALVPDDFAPTVERLQRSLHRSVAALEKKLAPGDSGRTKTASRKRRGKGPKGARRPSLFIKVDDLMVIRQRLPVMPDLFLVELNRKSHSDMQRQQKIIKKYHHKMAWCLPPVILEQDLEFFATAIRSLLQRKFHTWQIGHIGQLKFFTRKDGVNLLGDYTLNILNGQGLKALAALGLQRAQTAIEIDRKSLADLIAGKISGKARVGLGMTVYGTPPLFTARAAADHFRYNVPFVSPRGETFVLHKTSGLTVALAEEPFSLLNRLPELARLGVQFGVIDLCRRRIERKELDEISRQLSGRGTRKKLSTFNYFGTLE